MSTIREGSSLYYSLLWTEARARQRFIDRLALIQALGSTLDDVQEPQVAERKIHWWHEELQRMVDGEARHPATKGCQDAIRFTDSETDAENPAGQSAGLAACLALLSAVSTSRFSPPATSADADELIEQSFTARLALLSHALSSDIGDLDTASHSAQVARALGKFDQLSRLPPLLHRGHAVFSDDTYQKYKLRPTDLASHIRVASNTEGADDVHAGEAAAGSADSERAQQSSSLNAIPVVVENPARVTLIADAIADTHAELTTACNEPAVSQRYRTAPLLPLWRLVILREKQVKLWQQKQPDLLRERLTMTPLSKLFWAWRNKR